MVKNFYRDLEIFRDHLKGHTTELIAEKNNIGVSRVHNVIMSIATKLRRFAVSHDHYSWPSRSSAERRKNQVQLLSLLDLYAEALQRQARPEVTHPAFDVGLEGEAIRKMKHLNIQSIADLQTMIRTQPAQIIEVYGGERWKVLRLEERIKRYLNKSK